MTQECVSPIWNHTPPEDGPPSPEHCPPPTNCDCPTEPGNSMTQINNYYYYDSHNVTTTTTNNYSSTDNPDTTSNTDGLGPLVTVGDVNVDPGVPNIGILDNLHTGDILGPSLTPDLLNGTTTTLGGELLPHAGDVLSSLDTASVPILPDSLNNVGSGNLEHVDAGLAPSVGDLLSHFGSADLSGLSADIPTTIAAPLTDIVGDIAGGSAEPNVAPVVGDVVGDVADAGLANGSIGDVVAHLASIGSADSTAPPISTDIGHGITADTVGAVSSIAASPVGDLVHSLGSLDLSDVGAVLNPQPVHDVAASNLDLDHLTSTLNLFDLGHLDLGYDIHHA